MTTPLLDVMTVSGYTGLTSEPRDNEDDGRVYVELVVMTDDGEKSLMLLIEPLALATLAQEATIACKDDYPQTWAEAGDSQSLPDLGTPELGEAFRDLWADVPEENE